MHSVKTLSIHELEFTPSGEARKRASAQAHAARACMRGACSFTPWRWSVLRVEEKKISLKHQINNSARHRLSIHRVEQSMKRQARVPKLTLDRARVMCSVTPDMQSVPDSYIKTTFFWQTFEAARVIGCLRGLPGKKIITDMKREDLESKALCMSPLVSSSFGNSLQKVCFCCIALKLLVCMRRGIQHDRFSLVSALGERSGKVQSL